MSTQGARFRVARRAAILALVISMAMPWQAAAFVLAPSSAPAVESSSTSPATATLVPILVKFRGSANPAEADAATREAGGDVANLHG